jgi:hypothetical protein
MPPSTLADRRCQVLNGLLFNARRCHPAVKQITQGSLPPRQAACVPLIGAVAHAYKERHELRTVQGKHTAAA